MPWERKIKLDVVFSHSSWEKEQVNQGDKNMIRFFFFLKRLYRKPEERDESDFGGCNDK